MIVGFVDIGGIVDHHCLKVIVLFVDIDGIDDLFDNLRPCSKIYRSQQNEVIKKTLPYYILWEFNAHEYGLGLGLWCLTPLTTLIQLYRFIDKGTGENHRPAADQ